MATNTPTTDQTWRRRLSAISWGDRLVYGAVLALFLAGLSSRALWRALDPQSVASVAFHGPHAAHHLDPWGTLYRDEPGLPAYSCGPNRRDEGGLGDDVMVLPAQDWRVWAYTDGGEWVLCLLAIFLGALWEGGRQLAGWLRTTPRRGSAFEATRLALIALPVGLAGGFLVQAILAQAPAALTAQLESYLWVPVPLAAGGTLALGAWLLLLATRLGLSDISPEPGPTPHSQNPPPGTS